MTSLVLGPGDTVEGWALYLTAVAAGLGAVLYLLHALVKFGGWVRVGFRRVQALGDLLEHELTPNHGGSMKDNLTSIARGLGSAQRRLADIEKRLNALERNHP